MILEWKDSKLDVKLTLSTATTMDMKPIANLHFWMPSPKMFLSIKILTKPVSCSDGSDLIEVLRILEQFSSPLDSTDEPSEPGTCIFGASSCDPPPFRLSITRLSSSFGREVNSEVVGDANWGADQK